MKRVRLFCLIVAAIMLMLTFTGCTNDNAPYGYESLAGCWVTKDDDGIIYAVQFMSDGSYYSEYIKGDNVNSDSGVYYTEKDGTLRMGTRSFCDYKRSGNKLFITSENEKREFIMWDKNIGHIKEYDE